VQLNIGVVLMNPKSQKADKLRVLMASLLADKVGVMDM